MKILDSYAACNNAICNEMLHFAEIQMWHYSDREATLSSITGKHERIEFFFQTHFYWYPFLLVLESPRPC